MRSDLDRLMHTYNLDAIVVLGDETPNTFRDYLTGRAKANGNIFKKRDEQAVIIVNGMEVDEAAKSGLRVMTYYDFDFAALYEQFGSQPGKLRRELFLNYFRKLDIRGRVGFYGAAAVNGMLPNLLHLIDSNLGVELALEDDTLALFSHMYETKDIAEIAALREAGRLTSEVVRRAWDFLSSHYASDQAIGSPIINEYGEPLTIGAVRRYIQAQETALGLEDSEGFIFAQGRDAGMPHSVGEDSDVLEVGRSIVFDIFPRGGESGYFHDMTRTWCLGRAADDVQAAYDDVMHAFHMVMHAFKVGAPTSQYQVMVLDYFESRGHATQRSKPGTMEGYVHSLGHGIGLNVHEAPMFGEKSTHVLQVGNAFTVEPGLYYPERGYGVRVEDSVYIDEHGVVQRLTDFPYDLVVPLRKR
ncbi:MAG: aminopeptidase P family protein [Chloroflexi bacterium CFX4]|nr:aminopeptidase P family protein [Chloroflexi bacterium CFX4]MDL1921721.1 aminopeptidase P family protein [Chloroflexi bacterium CFX3]